MRKRRGKTELLFLLLALLGPAVTVLAQPVPPQPAEQPAALGFFGVNGYFTGAERDDFAEIDALSQLAQAVGMHWTREEFVWVHIEPRQDDFDFTYRWPYYDDRIWRIGKRDGLGIIGMLLTTPEWARKPSCAGSYWCPPQNPSDYYDFVRRTVEHYDGDGYEDCAGSPRIAYWEIWNEPNFQETWPGSAAEYAALLQAGYNGVKAADPTAQVLVGGVYVFDGTAGLAFLNDVLAADPNAWNHFDILSIHPYMPNVAPDQPGLWEPSTMLSRLQRAQDWVGQHGGGKAVWVTEVGWSTCTAGQGDCSPDQAKTEEQQANYLLRTHVMALATGIAHLSTFQLEDKFDGSASQVWGGCAVLRTAAEGYAPKIAYSAYAVMVQQLQGTVYSGTGPLHALQWREVGGKRYLNAASRSDYRFSVPGGGTVDVLWRPDEQDESLSFPVVDHVAVTWIERDGQQHSLVPVNGQVHFTINGRPGYLRQEPLPQPPVLAYGPEEIGFLCLLGQEPAPRQLQIRNDGGGTLEWTIQVDSGGGWFSAEPLSGSGAATVTVGAAAPGSAGLYTGTLSIDAGPAGQGQVVLWLRLAGSLQHSYLPLIYR
ncbi:MAG: cellulase family glycosylhydrolase [Chloroflexia bacterium]|nr:cellulase family glycosylhydrolase [Chloroflexia bacterium]